MAQQNGSEQPVPATKDEAAAVQPLFPVASPAIPEPAPGEYTWGSEEGLIISADEFEGAVGHDPNRVLKKKNALPPSAWVEGPGAVEVLIEGLKLLRGAAKAAGTPIKEIKAVIVKALPKRDLILVAPALEGTAGAIPTRREGRGPLKFTISDILREAEMEITSGYRELYRVEKVSVSPIGPAIAIETAVSMATRRVKKRKKDSGTDQGEQ
jgi:hypothetical protein